MEIGLQGARQVRETMPDAFFVFLKPPSLDELVREGARRMLAAALEAEADAYVSAPLIQKFRLREGIFLSGRVEPARKGTQILATAEVRLKRGSTWITFVPWCSLASITH